MRCFENVAAHLADDGAFVVEAAVPAHINGLRENQYVDAEEIGVDEVWLDVAKLRPRLAAARGDARVAQRRGRRAPVPDRDPLLLTRASST